VLFSPASKTLYRSLNISAAAAAKEKKKTYGALSENNSGVAWLVYSAIYNQRKAADHVLYQLKGSEGRKAISILRGQLHRRKSAGLKAAQLLYALEKARSLIIAGRLKCG